MIVDPKVLNTMKPNEVNLIVLQYRWYYKGMTVIKEHIDAANWNEAKNAAINIVKDYFNRQAIYWRDMKIGFTNWVEEE